MQGFKEWHLNRFGYEAGGSPPDQIGTAANVFRRLVDALDEYSAETALKIASLESEVRRLKTFLVSE